MNPSDDQMAKARIEALIETAVTNAKSHGVKPSHALFELLVAAAAIARACGGGENTTSMLQKGVPMATGCAKDWFAAKFETMQ